MGLAESTYWAQVSARWDWAIVAFFETEKHFQRVNEYKQL